jgi:hypothetical protein
MITVMQRGTDRIYTTHVGSLARPTALLDLMKAPAGPPAGSGPDRRPQPKPADRG